MEPDPESMDEPDSHRVPDYMLALCVLVPVLVFVIFILTLYICCSKRFRLNWFEQNLLATAEERQHINECSSASLSQTSTVQAQFPTSYPSGSFSSTTSAGSNVLIRQKTLHQVPRLSVTSAPPAIKYQSTHAAPPLSPRYHDQLSPRLSVTDQLSPMAGDGNGRFWLPGNIASRKRAQSLVAALLHHDNEEEDTSSNTSPILSSSLQELSQVTLSGGDSPNQIQDSAPAGFNRQRRRASMHDAIDHTKINTRLYDEPPDRVGSFTSIQEEKPLGMINVTLSLNHEANIMTVRIIQARDLIPRDLSGTVNPYCQICLLPFRKNVVQTKHCKKTVNPEFEEEFLFEVLPQQLQICVLEVRVFDFDQFSRDECLGQAHITLDCLDFTDKHTLWRPLTPYERDQKEHTNRGDLMFSMGYLTSAQRLTVVVMKARNLRSEKEKTVCDPLVKISLILNGKRLKKKKTSAARNTLNPTWNEAIVFNVANECLRGLVVDITVVNDALLGYNELLGRVQLGMESDGEELHHWNDMIRSKSATARWHHLTL